jgi:hypothetical protein
LLVNVALFFGVLVLLLVIAEFAAFLLFGRVQYGQQPGLFQVNENYEYHFAPSQNSSFDVPFSFNSTIITNSHGLRDDEVSYENPLNKTRVLFLGDSVTECWGVDTDYCFVTLLEDLFNNGTGSFEFINAGVRNYGTKLEYLFFKHEGYKYSPDFVVVSFSSNDLKDNFQENSIVGGILNQGKRQSDAAAYAFTLAKKSSLFNYIYYYLGRKLKLEAIVNHYDDVPKYSGREFVLDPDSREWNVSKEYFIKINELCEGLGCRLIITMSATLGYYRKHPEDISLDSEEFVIRDILQSFSEASNISFVSVLDELYPYAAKGIQLTFKTDGHYSELGNSLFANLTYPKLNKLVRGADVYGQQPVIAG